MNYKLAKKIKDAGFPQLCKLGITMEPLVCSKSGKECKRWCGNSPSCKGDHVHAPTLSELIEEIDRKKYVIHLNMASKCYAEAQRIGGPVTIIKGEGDTPEEAIAFLYLKLNKK